MNGITLAYPLAPTGIPPGLARTTRRYRGYVLVVQVSLVVFLLLYLTLIVATGYLLWLLLSYPLRGDTGQMIPIVFFFWVTAVAFVLRPSFYANSNDAFGWHRPSSKNQTR